MVNYRSTALAETAPELVSSVDSKDTSRIPAILAANQQAERVREDFKRKGRARRNSAASNKNGAPLDEEADKAGRYDRRLKMNRESAAASRVRREAYIKALEQQLLIEHEKYGSLRAEFDAERAAHSKLRSDVESARLLAAAPVPTAKQQTSIVMEQVTPTQTSVQTPAQPASTIPASSPQIPLDDVKDEDLLSELDYLPQPDTEAFNSLLFGNGGAIETQPPAPLPLAAQMYSANVTDLFTDLGLPLTQIPSAVAGIVDPLNTSENIDTLMNLDTE